jgi:mannose-6-phosphate isomerase
MATREELKQIINAPIPMARNTYLHFYNGGKLRAEFVGDPSKVDDFYSEEWFFSTNRAITPGRDNPPDKGFSKIRMPSGEIINITQLLEAFPNEVLGKAHAAKYGPTLGLLVKLFDVGEGAHIPVHWHPSPAFSKKYLKNDYGKNESWGVVNTRPGAKVWVGWKKDVDPKEFRKWMDAQDVQTMRKHMYEIELKPGMVTFLRDSIVHSLGEGCCILEPQEPTDWNILAEWEGFPYGKEDGTCGVGWDTALQAADFSAMKPEYLNDYILRKPRTARQEDGNVEVEFLPEEARPYFWLTRYTVKTRMAAPQSPNYYGIIVTRGKGVLKGDFKDVAIRRGLGVLIPACVDGVDFVNTGSDPLEIFCCFPPKSA